MTQERLIFSNHTPSEPRLSPAAMKSDDMQSALTTSLPCASILQPATPPDPVALRFHRGLPAFNSGRKFEHFAELTRVSVFITE